MFIICVIGTYFYYNMFPSTNKMAIENFEVEVDVQNIILYFFNFYYLLVNVDSIISLASVMHVAWSSCHELHHMDKKKPLKPFSNSKMKVNQG